jgi:wyosine [tRNA(Phe)-imidazoG37] synthetase (radical SAM superfamily)
MSVNAKIDQRMTCNHWLCHCQLYVSVDAATKERLKAIDRPLFTDFWERFVVSSFLPLYFRT